MGAWIETTYLTTFARPSSVAPYMGAWIETWRCPRGGIRGGSHPIWVRGLKQDYTLSQTIIITSHPIWVRGLKHRAMFLRKKRKRRTLYGCVD